MSEFHRCDGKRLFRSERGVRQELRRMRRNTIDWFRLESYWCDRHNGWHIGNRFLFPVGASCSTG